MMVQIEIWNNNLFLGSMHVRDTNKEETISDINRKFGEGNWTKYNAY